jgi:hypothetical protein
MLSLPQALANANLEHLLHQSQPSLIKSRQILRTKKGRCDPLGCSSAEDEEQENEKSRRNRRRSRRRQSQVSIMARNGDGPNEGRQTLEKKRSVQSKASNETLQSRETLAKRRRGAVIDRTDTKSRLARKEPIPKWINVEINVLPKAFTPSQALEMPVKPVIPALHKDLIPLTDLAMILSSNLDTAIANGLYDPKKTKPKLRRRRLGTGTLSTVTSCPVLSSLLYMPL